MPPTHVAANPTVSSPAGATPLAQTKFVSDCLLRDGEETSAAFLPLNPEPLTLLACSIRRPHRQTFSSGYTVCCFGNRICNTIQGEMSAHLLNRRPCRPVHHGSRSTHLSRRAQAD